MRCEPNEGRQRLVGVASAPVERVEFDPHLGFATRIAGLPQPYTADRGPVGAQCNDELEVEARRLCRPLASQLDDSFRVGGRGVMLQVSGVSPLGS